MTKCPGCNATLPDGAFHCQFCGAQFGTTPRPARPAGRVQAAASPSRWGEAMPGSPRWVLPVYYAIAVWWMLGGIWNVIQVTVFGEGGIGFFDWISIVFGGLTALIGFGLIMRWDDVRDVVNVLCFLRIIFGLFGIVQGFLLAGLLGVIGIFIMIGSIIDVLTGFLMIYLLGETETRARDI